MSAVTAQANSSQIEFENKPSIATRDLSNPPAAQRWVFEACVIPGAFDRNGEAGVVFQGATGAGLKLKVRPFGGGVMLESTSIGAHGEKGELLRNPTMNLAEGDYSFRQPFRVRLMVGDGRAQLYLGFHGLPADFIHAEYIGHVPEITKVSAYSHDAEVRFNSIKIEPLFESLPDLNARPPVGAAMPTWSEFVGTHYVPREPFHLYRGLFYDPVIYRLIARREEKPTGDFRPWVAYALAGELPEGCVERRGPFSGKSVLIRMDRVQQMLDWAETHDARLVHGRDVLKRTEYLSPDEVALRKDELYWSVRVLYEGRVAEASRIILQIGNEVNAFHVPWKNHPDLARRYVEYNFAPAAETIRRVSQDLYGTPDRIPIMLGSVTSPWPLAHGWMTAVANYHIEGDWAPNLRGMTVASLARNASIHYAMKGPFWSQALDAAHARLVKPGKIFGLWSTEEVGANPDLHRAPFVTAIPFRYMDWWSRRDWKPGRGAVIFWGDTRGKETDTAATAAEMLLGLFLGSRQLVNETDHVTSTGSPDREIYAFATKEASPPRIVLAALSRSYWFYPKNLASGDLQIEKLALRRPDLANSELRIAWYRISDAQIEPIIQSTVKIGPDGEVALPHAVVLDRSQEQILVGFAAPLADPIDQVFSFHPQR